MARVHRLRLEIVPRCPRGLSIRRVDLFLPHLASFISLHHSIISTLTFHSSLFESDAVGTPCRIDDLIRFDTYRPDASSRPLPAPRNAPYSYDGWCSSQIIIRVPGFDVNASS